MGGRARRGRREGSILRWFDARADKYFNTNDEKYLRLPFDK